ncbi:MULTISPECIES: hypothetical protein [Corallococcus]|nr:MULTISPECIES: hypothetical protein [Corallococcus]NBD14450.1 hypothetical protein [Corallococcus silvisoli]
MSRTDDALRPPRTSPRDKRPDPAESATMLELGREVVATPPGDTRE